MASGCFDKTLGIWDTRSGAMQYSFNHNDLVYSIDFSPAGDHLASAERDGTVRVWRYSHIPYPSGGIQIQEG